MWGRWATSVAPPADLDATLGVDVATWMEQQFRRSVDWKKRVVVWKKGLPFDQFVDDKRSGNVEDGGAD